MKKTILYLGMVAMAFAACDNTPKFHIEGNISDAADKTLYLENIALGGVVIMDSAKLNSNGSFSFAAAAPQSPEFYRLRIEDHIINFSVDSTETVNVKATWEKMATDYTIDGENNQKIKELANKQIQLQNTVQAIGNSKSLAPGDAQDSILNCIHRYKKDVEQNYIIKGANKPYAYFALFQTVNGYLIFDPINDKEDVRCFAAVATSWDQYYPHSDRAGNLHNIAIRGLKNVRTPQETVYEIDESKISQANLINIALPDVKGRIHNLTDLTGKVVLLDFTIYGHTASAQRNMELRQIYDKYKDMGLEIYQISLDADEHFWKTNADNLPWICVRDANGLYSSNVRVYGVQDLPTYFVIDRSNSIVKRSEDITDLQAEISKYL